MQACGSLHWLLQACVRNQSPQGAEVFFASSGKLLAPLQKEKSNEYLEKLKARKANRQRKMALKRGEISVR